MQQHYPLVGSMIKVSAKLKLISIAVMSALAAGCGVTSRLEPYKQTSAVIQEGEHVVVLARKHHATHETEQEFVQCVSDALADSDHTILVQDSTEFEDMMYPWFEPSMAPLNTADLSELLDRPGLNQEDYYNFSVFPAAGEGSPMKYALARPAWVMLKRASRMATAIT